MEAWKLEDLLLFQHTSRRALRIRRDILPRNQAAVASSDWRCFGGNGVSFGAWLGRRSSRPVLWRFFFLFTMRE
jgi:hypothetical protein